MLNVRISIKVGGGEEKFDVVVPAEDVSYFHERLYRTITDVIWKENHYQYDFARFEGYDLGSGAGCGEEYSSIPEYEGPPGYDELLNELGGYLPQTFRHPKNGHRFVAIEYLGSEVDEGYKYIDIDADEEAP